MMLLHSSHMFTELTVIGVDRRKFVVVVLARLLHRLLHCGSSMLLARRSASATQSLNRMRRSVACQTDSTGRTRVAVVGDVHDQWSAKDAAALKVLDADFTLFVGDFGNERVSVVREIASIDAPKAVILGNHDAWYTMTARARSRSQSPPADAAAAAAAAADAQQPPPDRVQQQLDALGDCHIGYNHMQLPDSNISLVGARPFSKGGKSMRTIKDFMARLYSVHDLGESAQRIMQLIQGNVPPANSLILMGHNGPAGLGAQRHNICGVDWVREAGDHGDPDFASVLQQCREAGRHVALVVFGHMHHKLRGSGNRQMVHVDDTGCVYLNAATVPRVVAAPRKGLHEQPATRHHFLVIELQDGHVQCAADTWVQVTEHAADVADSSSSSSQSGTAQQQAVSADHSTCSSCMASHELLAASQQANSSNALQLLLDWQPRNVQGFSVQAVEAREVLRMLGEDGSSDSRRIQYWDAFNAAWQDVHVPSRVVADGAVAVAAS